MTTKLTPARGTPKYAFFLLLLMSAIAWTGTSATDAQRNATARQLLQEAIHEEEALGNATAALELYERVLSAATDDERGVAATAQLRLGLLHERLGRQTEAQRAFEQVLGDYADQPEQVSAAQARLAALTQPTSSTNATTMLTRRVWQRTGGGLGGSLTPDGRYLTFTAWTTGGDLAVRELATGQTRRLTDQRSTPDYEYALYSATSPDGRRVVFRWFNGKDGQYEIRTVGFDGSEPRVLYASEEVSYPIPERWSPDGKQILALFPRKDRTTQIVLISVEDGSLRVVKTLDWRYPRGMSFSPDGRSIVYAFPPDEDTEAYDIFVLAADGTREIPLVQHPANDVFPTWTPDGKYVLFHSDRTGVMGAWVHEVADGRPVGRPTLIKPDIGRSMPLGFTPEGSYYYVVQSGMKDIFTAEIDLGTGDLLTPPTKAVEHFTGSNHVPAWSPDGRYLAYVSHRSNVPPSVAHSGGSMVIAIRSLETGEERELPLNLSGLAHYPHLRWSPDGQSFLLPGRDKKNRGGIYKIDAETGEVTAIVQDDDPQTSLAFWGTVWSRDGRSVFYSHPKVGSGLTVYSHDLESGQARELYSERAPIPQLSLSPDGRQLAFMSEGRGGNEISFKVMPANGGDARTVFRARSINFIDGELAWTPDGRELLFGKRIQSGAGYEQTELWRISIEGGEPQRIDLAMAGLGDFHLHPDGRHIAFTVGTIAFEVWVMENFLPALEGNPGQ